MGIYLSESVEVDPDLLSFKISKLIDLRNIRNKTYSIQMFVETLLNEVEEKI